MKSEAVKPSVTISKIKFSGGDEIHLKENEKVIIVGPNNSGKSQSLRDIYQICKNGPSNSNIAVVDIEISKTGYKDQLLKFLENNAELNERKYIYQDWKIHELNINLWDQKYLLNDLTDGFVRKITATNRLNICEQQASIKPNEQKTKPQHILYDNDEKMSMISGLFKDAFGKDLMFEFRGGSVLPIHVGNIPDRNVYVDRASTAYSEEVRKNPLLDKQGDGMKSYAGILFEALVSQRDITLIDEPEAFLHPPQMRRLGKVLASEVERQLFVATHSSDILRGFLEGTRGNIRILRIHRDGDKNRVFEASLDALKDLWEKPILRYSNALDGIFHEQTIICEDNSDCRLINAIADHAAEKSNETWQDTAYVPAGGKHQIHYVARVLRQIGVPVKAIFDIDFLSEKSLVKETVEAFGGNWQELQTDWERVDNVVKKEFSSKSPKEIRDEIYAILKDSNENELPKRDIINAMKKGNSWNTLKRLGQNALPRGQAQTQFNQLKKKLEEIGIFIVYVGEIENFFRDIGGHGPKYVTKLLSDIKPDDDRLEELRNFVKAVHYGNHAILPSNSYSTIGANSPINESASSLCPEKSPA